MNNTFLKSAIYEGRVTHHRFDDVKHDFNYQLFMLFLDLDEMPDIFQSFRFYSVEKFNLAVFRRSNHFGEKTTSLKDAVYALVKTKKNITLEGPVRLLTQLQYFGYYFSPINLYYCYDKLDTKVEVVILEVNNTPWGEQHCYILPICESSGTQELQNYIIKKSLHVSPLMPMDILYDVRLRMPKETLGLTMVNLLHNKPFFRAELFLTKREINAKNLNKMLLNYPFMTAKIIISIYWQSLKTWIKGATFYNHP